MTVKSHVRAKEIAATVRIDSTAGQMDFWRLRNGFCHHAGPDLGAVRALATAALVAASAIGPGIAGFLIDAGIDLDMQSFGYAAYCLAGALLFYLLRHAFQRRIAETADLRF